MSNGTKYFLVTAANARGSKAVMLQRGTDEETVEMIVQLGLIRSRYEMEHFQMLPEGSDAARYAQAVFEDLDKSPSNKPRIIRGAEAWLTNAFRKYKTIEAVLGRMNPDNYRQDRLRPS